ncbi:MAG: hypothetical protein KDD50_02570 [Bdellovibrionales bacterium]|nr:hypothetical protein [Bdellovibrionales bacterium]
MDSLISSIFYSKETLLVNYTGNLYAIGSFSKYNGTTKYGVLRILSDGTLDPAWNASQVGTNGFTYGILEEVNSVNGLPTGNIILGGRFQTYNGATVPDSLIRIDSTGAWDASFNNGGDGAWGMSGGYVGLSNELTMDGGYSGKILYGGFFQSYNGVYNSENVFRLNSDGTYDSSFNSAGSGLDDGSTYPRGRKIISEIGTDGAPTGKYLLSGRFRKYNGSAISTENFVRLLSNGTLDSSFNSCCTGTNGEVADIIYHRDASGNYTGKHWIIGNFSVLNGTKSTVGLVIVDNAGNIDTNFNTGGVGSGSTTLTPRINKVIRERLPSGDYTGKYLVFGNFTHYNGDDVPDGAIRLNADGSWDNTFNSDQVGATLKDLNAIEELGVDDKPTGKLFLMGSFTAYNGQDVPDYFARINNDGSWDSTFNSSGSGFSGSIGAIHVAKMDRDTATGLPNGKILVGGQIDKYNGGSVGKHIARLNSDGSLDSSFNTGTGFSGLNDDVYAITLEYGSNNLPTGNYFIAGDLSPSYNSTACPNNIAKLANDGSLITSFNTSGTGTDGFTYDILQIRNTSGDYTDSLFVVGNLSSYNSTSVPSGVIKINKNGVIDTGFNSGKSGIKVNSTLIATKIEQVVTSSGVKDQFNVYGNFPLFNDSVRPSVFSMDSNAQMNEFYFGNGE